MYKFAGPSVQRRVGNISGWSKGQRVLFSIVTRTPSAQKLSAAKYFKSLCRSFGALRLDFLVHPSGRRPKIMTFWHRPRKSKIRG